MNDFVFFIVESETQSLCSVTGFRDGDSWNLRFMLTIHEDSCSVMHPCDVYTKSITEDEFLNWMEVSPR